MIDDKVKDYSDKLRKLGIKHEIIEHPDLRTPPEVMTYLNLEIALSAPTLIMKTDIGFVAVIRRGDCKLDFEKIKKQIGAKSLRLADPEEYGQTVDAPLGAAKVFNPGLRTLIDKRIFEKEYLYGGTGSFTSTFRYKTEDLKKIPESAVVLITTVKEPTTGKIRRVFSGVRANARPHIGNYLGAMKGMVELQDNYDCIFSVVDLHTVLVPYDPKTLQQSIRDVVLDYLGAGLDPKRCHILIQSHLAAEHTELAYYLGCIYPVSRIEDLPTYKDKKETYPDYVNVGLFYYPVLMAADILLYNAELVPVGIDNEPHLEVAREMARKFNSLYGTKLVEPKRHATPGGSVPSLTGEGKMSKSKGGTIVLTDSLGEIKQTLARAVTDEGKGEKFPETGPAANLVMFVELFEGHDRAMQYKEAYKNKGIRYGDLKRELAEAIYKELAPIQKRRRYYEERPKLVDEILEDGRIYCQKIARQTLLEVKKAMGLV